MPIDSAVKGRMVSKRRGIKLPPYYRMALEIEVAYNTTSYACLAEILSRVLWEVKEMLVRYKVVAAASIALWLAGCSRHAARPSQPQSRYLAGAVCAGCHSEIAKTYRQT